MFTDGAPLPAESTADGVGTPPAIEWSEAPPDAKAIALVCEDPDAPMTAPYVHWIAIGLRGTEGKIDAAATSGKNSKLTTGFAPAAPPRGHGVHHYHFQVFALDDALDLERGIGRAALASKMRGHVVGWGELIGTYQRT
jgi:Raf kinase inhibitor-like YbhB/YbcL family protein